MCHRGIWAVVQLSIAGANVLAVDDLLMGLLGRWWDIVAELGD
jgi:hypothetical protein